VGLLVHDAPGPAFTLAHRTPLLQSHDDSSRLVGFGAGPRVEVYPFYQSLLEAQSAGAGVLHHAQRLARLCSAPGLHRRAPSYAGLGSIRT
jgi:hypothetical protein